MRKTTTSRSTKGAVVLRGHARLDSDAAVNEMTIRGNGFFIVRDPATGKAYATQTGYFNLDHESYLVTAAGARVQGRTNGSLSTMGDVQINTAGAGTAEMLCYSIDERGRIIVYLTDGTSFLRGQIMLQNFRDPEALVSEGSQLFSNLAAAGPLPALSTPCTNGLGQINWGVLELAHAGSNVWTN